jgi:hypothetical protein
MHRLPVFVLAAAVVCAAACGAARPQPAAALSHTDAQVKQNVLLLRGYIDRQATGQSFLYPIVAQVRKGGGLKAPVWPTNPWTAKPMARGTGRGTYTYTPAADRHSYVLVAHFSKGSYKLSGGSPAWLAGERATAATDLAAAQSQLTAAETDLTSARDTEAELGARVIKGYIDAWGTANNGTAPLLTAIAVAGVGADQGFWPQNPWVGGDMAVGSGPGDLAYTHQTDGVSYLLGVHRATDSVDLSGTVPQTMKHAMDLWKDEAMKADMGCLQAAVDRYAADNNDTLPATVSSQALADYVDFWPENPWFGVDMAAGSNPGEFTYTPIAYDDYHIAGHLSDGSDYVVDGSWFKRAMGLRERLKDLCVEGYAQVLKDYVDEWQSTHGDALPTVDQMTASGDVGTAHTWWPNNPFTSSAMQPGGSTGEFTYTPADDGTFTVQVQQAPISPFPATYTAQ